MNSILINATEPSCQRAQAADRVLALAWRHVFASQGAVRLRDDETGRVAAACAAAVPTAAAPKTNVVVPVATAVAHIPGSVAWSPPPC